MYKPILVDKLQSTLKFKSEKIHWSEVHHK